MFNVQKSIMNKILAIQFVIKSGYIMGNKRFSKKVQLKLSDNLCCFFGQTVASAPTKLP